MLVRLSCQVPTRHRWFCSLCGRTWATLTPRLWGQHTRWCRDKHMEFFMGLLRKINRAAEKLEKPVALEDFPELADYPTLFEFLTSTRWEDGAGRITGTFTMSYDRGRLKCSLNDRDGGNFVFVTLSPAEVVWEQLERVLSSPSTEWRESEPVRGFRRK